MTVSIAQKDFVESYLEKERQPLSPFCFTNIFAWRDFFRFRFEEIDGHLCIFAENDIGCFLYLPPLGSRRTPALFDKCFAFMEGVNKGNGVSRIENVNEQMKALFPEEQYSFYKKGYEYFYYREDIAELKGTAYKSKRSSFNQFMKAHEAGYFPFESGMTEECLSLYDEWARQRAQAVNDDVYQAMLEENRQEHQQIMAHYKDLELEGRVVTIDGKIKAYTFGGAIYPDIFCVFLEVADLTAKGLPVFIFNRFCQDKAVEPYRFINVMEDFEWEGLRRAKMSFRPAFLMPLYTVSKK